MNERSVASGLLLLLAGVWLLLQTLAGDLPGRLLSYAGAGGDACADGDLKGCLDKCKKNPDATVLWGDPTTLWDCDSFVKFYEESAYPD